MAAIALPFSPMQLPTRHMVFVAMMTLVTACGDIISMVRSVLGFLDPSEYAHILSSIPSSQVARFRDHISAHELILQHPQSGCGCDLTCIDFTGEVHGFCGNDDMCDGVWEYFCGSCLAHLNPREYAHIYSPSQISRISEFFVKKAEVSQKQAAAIQTAHDCACVD